MVQEEKSMRTKKGILVLSLALVLLLAVYLGLRAWNWEEEERAKEEEEAAEIYVTDTDGGDIVSLKFNVGNGELEFTKEDGEWSYTQDPDFPLQQGTLGEMAEAAGNVRAARRLEDGDSLADYGLEEPSYTIEYTDTDGNTTLILFGNMTGEDYYVTVGDTGTVYTVGSTVVDPFNYTLEDLAQLDEYPGIGSGNLVREVITENGVTTTYDSSEEDQSEDIAAIAGGLGAVTLSEAADYSVDEEDLPGFGLDEESRITVEVTYTQDEEERVMMLYIGAEDGNGNRYVMLDDSRIVYLITEEICNNILNI